MSKSKTSANSQSFIQDFSDIVSELQKDNPNPEQRHTLHVKDMMDNQGLSLDKQLSIVRELIKHLSEVPEQKRMAVENLLIVIKDDIEDSTRPSKDAMLQSSPEGDHSFDV